MKTVRLLLQLIALALAACAAAGARADVAQEDTTARYQVTYNWQYHPAFASPYASVNSLGSSPARMYTLSATAHWGTRVWEGGEAYFNPEVVSGVPFAPGLVGLGGFTNGEITRAAGSSPKLYRQRLFVRQTWNRGGGAEEVEPDFNQLGGRVDRRRLVLTAGNFSTLDVFDDNTYAKDPRTQFMNWNHWTYAAWDYAADSRGYGWGAALEAYEGDWVIRAARMTGPREPNGLPVDFNLGRHFGDQLELERAYSLAGLPGKVRLLGYRNRAVLASFSDATSFLLANPGTDPQAILRVRNGEKTKTGVGVNLEQAIGAGMGVFLRAMRSDGRTETYAFTEVDQSLAAGTFVEGSNWGRARDAAGIAFSRNGLSPERRRYLAAGGLSFFIGDGALQYRPESVVETFYSLGLAGGIRLSADYQRIQNPAYNASRGAVNVVALRFHAEF